MSDYEQLQKTVSILTTFEIVFLIIAAVCLVVAIVLFFKYKIPNVISEVSGKKKQKQLAEMTSNKHSDDKQVLEVKYESVDNLGSRKEEKRKRSDTIQKDDVKASKRHETTLSSNRCQTIVMDKSHSRNGPKKQHHTVVMEKIKAVDKKYDTLDETVLIHSDEIIE